MTTTQWTLRPATPDDHQSMVKIWYRGWQDAHRGRVPDSLLAHRRIADFRSLVTTRLPFTTIAQIGSHPVGFVVVKTDEVEQIYVDPEARGTGVAAALLRHAEDVIGNLYQRAWLAVVAGNQRARDFYQRNGWTDGGEYSYQAATAAGGTVEVPVHRYEKPLRDGRRKE
jgi:GNAT superfamily N-acetyltransferase